MVLTSDAWIFGSCVTRCAIAAVAALAVVPICQTICFQREKLTPLVNVPQESVPEATINAVEVAGPEFLLLEVSRLFAHCNSNCVDHSSYRYLLRLF